MEHLNNEYNGKIQHAYNRQEKEIAGFSVDGYYEDETKIIIFEFRGCTYHVCPHCGVTPWRGNRVKIGDKFVQLSNKELFEREEARLAKIRQELKKPHQIIIEYMCQWTKKLKTINPESKTYPLLYKSSKQSSGVTEQDFISLVSQDRFFGFAVVDLESPQAVIDAHPNIPPIFDKVTINRQDVQGHILKTLDEKQLDQIFPKEENAFCYNAKSYLITSEMLKYYHDKGLKYKVEYFVMYYKAKPFENFVNTME